MVRASLFLRPLYTTCLCRWLNFSKFAQNVAKSSWNTCRDVHSSSILSQATFFGQKPKKDEDSKSESAIALRSLEFQSKEQKTRASFEEIIDEFDKKNPAKRGHIDFIKACLRNMEEFGVEKNLEVYKKILDVFPKDKMVAQNSLQIEFMHFPWHQNCAIQLLQQMEDNGVLPGSDVQMQLMRIFGYRSFPMRKFARMMYWMPKFKNASPWPVPNPAPNDTYELAMLAVKRITSVDLRTEISTYQTKDLEDSIEDTWIVSGQSPIQQELIEKHPIEKPIYVDGAFRVWLRKKSIAYFILRGDPSEQRPVKPSREEIDDVSKIHVWVGEENSTETDIYLPPSVHEQDDGTYFGICATGTSSRDSVLSWIRFLQKTNPKLNSIPVIFKLKAPSTAVVPVNSAQQQQLSATSEEELVKYDEQM